MADPALPHVLVYRNDLLERSETFIATQSRALRRYHPIFCGLQRRDNGALAADADAIVLGHEHGLLARMQRMAYLQTGFAPRWTRAIHAVQPALMHAHFALDAACALPLLNRLQIPLLVTLHGYDVTTSEKAMQLSRGGRLYLGRRTALFARTHTFICVSEFIRRKAIEAGFPAHKLWVHSIGIDLDEFQPVTNSQIDPNELSPMVLFVGRLVEKKGCAYLLEAMKAVQAKMPQATITIIGDGPLRTDLESTARALGIHGCTFLGAQPASVVRSWLARARLFSVPSITASNGDSEGLGMVFCEALATGVPVVSFNSGGIGEAVSNGITGLLVPEKDIPSLADAILTLLQDKSLWQRMRERGIVAIREKFDLRKQTAILEDKYDEAVSNSA